MLLDPTAEGFGTTTSILGVVPSWDGSRVIYELSVHGSDSVTVRVRDVRSGRNSDRIPGVRFANYVWRHDGVGFYYSNWPGPGSAPADGKAQLFYHRLGTAASSDLPLFGEGFDPTEGIADLVIDPNDHHLVIFVERLSSSTDLYHLDLRSGEKVQPLVRALGALFVGNGNAAIREDRLITVTEHRAPKRRVVSIPLNDPVEGAWRELVPEGEDILEGVTVVGDRMVARYLRKSSSRLVVYSMDGTRGNEIPLPGLGSVYAPPGEVEGEEGAFSFVSFHLPRTIYRYRPARRTPVVLDSSALPNLRRWLDTRQVHYRSRDGTDVSMFLVRRKSAKKDPRAPAVLEGYGGFGIPFIPAFDIGLLPFLRDGGTFAAPQLRGGGEYGRTWHDAGKLERKQNVFDDFIGAAEWLIEEGYTDREHLAIAGGSNGGLLVGACVTQRPELFRAAICAVPVLDMLRYQCFDGGSLWIPEYGSAEDPVAFDYLRRYSPYHNVRPGTRYPAVLLMTADTDTRVNPMHARKMTARLQTASSSGLPILLRTERQTGHGFGKSAEQTADWLTEVWSFLYDQLGVQHRV
jgi:prolyl oligopeptidase